MTALKTTSGRAEIADYMKCCSLIVRLRVGMVSSYQCLHYDDPYSQMCDVHTSTGEWKQGDGFWGRHLCLWDAYNNKFYGRDCGLGFVSQVYADQSQ